MTTKYSRRRVGLLLAGIFIYFFAGQAPPAFSAESYTFGVVPQYEQRQLFAIWKPLLDELEMRTGLSFSMVGVPTIPAFEKEFLKGSYDFVYMNPYHLLKANKSQGYAPLIHDRANLRGILVVRRESAIRNPSELSGKVVAFPSPNALGASLLMRADLARLFHADIAPLYVKTHNSVYLHVVKGLADAGGGVEKTLEEQAGPIRDALRILYTSRDMPAHPIAVHQRVPKGDAEKVRLALLEIAANEEGRALLARVPMKQPTATSMADYAPMLNWGLESFWVEE
jgi:phosphonate transport system substrate-binding protein